ncbi:MAG: sulfite exporter TauE/SafE family protein [Candidatus Gracilibacteria bacterium]|nr:sulfite exporter TauE/SafE family protein [Candidatus Gracilibacteria bacterium]
MKKIIQIKGMHCISCEMLLEKELKNIKDINLIMVSHKKGIMEVDFKDEFAYDKIVKIIEKNNFKVIENSQNKENNFDENNFLLNIIAILFVVILYIASKFIDFNSYIPNTNSINFLSAIFIGLIASLSTCLAITGGIIIGFSKYSGSKNNFLSNFKIQSLFQLGRILGFFIFGGILGLVGKSLSINFTFTGILTLFISFILIYIGLNILGLLPSITKFGIHMPKIFSSKIEKIKNPRYAPFVGALTFFLPCGFTQTMQLLAVSSGGFFAGGFVMMFFAIGTLPVLYSLGLGSSYFLNKDYKVLNKFIGAIIIFFGIFSLTNSYKLVNFIFDKNDNPKTEVSTIVNNDLEEINVSHNGWQTVPVFIKLKAGGNYKLVITPTSNGLGCMSTQAIPRLSNKVSYVKSGVPIIYEIYNAKPGKYDIVCASMGMNQGQIIIE